MKKITIICLILLLQLSIANCVTASELCLEYNAQTQYNTSVQGENNWFYQYYKGGKYSDMTFDTTRNLWRRPDGGGNYVGASTIHPGVGVGTARVWEAPSPGSITISSSGNVRKSAIGGDGVTVYIYKNDEVLWEQFIEGTDSVGYGYDLEADVSAGDKIYFLLTCENEAYGATTWVPTVEYTQIASFELNYEVIKTMADVTDESVISCTFYDKKEIEKDAIACMLVYSNDDALMSISQDNINLDNWETRQTELSASIDYGEESYEGWEAAFVLLTAEEGRFYSVLMKDTLCIK